MKDLVTIIYYTANTELFENKIIEDLKIKAGDIPIISVSRKPIDLGKNICIGEQPICYSNLWKQILIGLKEAKTEFCISAESDCLYPLEYFTFIPPVNNAVYRYKHIWIFWENRNKFWRKPRMEGAQICGRKYWIERLEYMLDNHKGWQPIENPNQLVRKIFETEGGMWCGNPVITFKTKNGISGKTSLVRNIPPVTDLPYWGDADFIRKKYLL